MKLLEHEAKKILAQFSVPVPAGTLITSPSQAPVLPAILKSQVPIGGRGKAGGIQKVTTAAEFTTRAAELFQKPIKGFIPRTLLAEEPLAIAREFYLSLLINRELETIELLAHTEGGVEIESHPAGSFFRTPLSAETIPHAADALASRFSLPHHRNDLEDLLVKLLACMTQSDATLIEINPLILTQQTTQAPHGTLIAGDCKMTLDDSATFRHPNWQFEQATTQANFVTLDQNGTVATIANGAGLAMATVDAVANTGLSPANFLDIGGGANSASVMAAFERIMEFPRVQAIVINIFAGITRCDEVAKAIIEARGGIKNLPPLFIRLAGTNVNEAKTLLDAHSITLLPTLEVCLNEAKKAVKHE